jgi:hypothetical protein
LLSSPDSTRSAFRWQQRFEALSTPSTVTKSLAINNPNGLTPPAPQKPPSGGQAPAFFPGRRPMSGHTRPPPPKSWTPNRAGTPSPHFHNALSHL